MKREERRACQAEGTAWAKAYAEKACSMSGVHQAV